MLEILKVTYLKNAYGYSVNDVLELCQGSSDVLKNIKVTREKIDIAIAENDFDKATRLLENMIEEYGLDNTEVIKAKTELDMEKFLEEEI